MIDDQDKAVVQHRAGKMVTFVFVSGAWHAGWCWERVLPLLDRHGHRALAPDLLGMGADPTPLGQVTLAGWADQIAALITMEPEPVILVGHSRGGAIISEVAERVPARIRSLVYASAFLLSDGESLATAITRWLPDQSGEFVVPGPDSTSTVHPDAVGPGFYHLAEVEWLEQAKIKVGPEPMLTFTEKLHLTEQNFGAVHRAYIECTQDRALPIAVQRQMRSVLPCSPVYTLDSDHSPFYSQPETFTDCLLNLASLL